MSYKNSGLGSITLRDIRIPDDYEGLATLLNLIESGSASPQSLKDEDQQMPTTSNLKKDENGLLVGFGRLRVIAESEQGEIIGYGSCFRAPWTDPGQVGSVFCVHPDYRCQGIGEQILSKIEGWANEHGATVLTSIVMDWIKPSLPFVQKRGFELDAHVYELELNLENFECRKKDVTEEVKNKGIKFITLADLLGDESERKLYELFVETQKDNPGQYGSSPPFAQWRQEFLPEDISRQDWVFIAVEDNRFVGVTEIFNTEDDGVLYTNYTGVLKEYRGRGIARALKLLSIEAAISEGAHTMTTDSEETNGPMQHLNRSLGYVPGNGHYRIVKRLA